MARKSASAGLLEQVSEGHGSLSLVSQYTIDVMRKSFQHGEVPGHLIQVLKVGGSVEHDWLRLLCPLLSYDSSPLFYPCFQLQLYIGSAAIVHQFSCNGTSSSLPFWPPISYIYRGPSALQNKQSPHPLL